MNRSFFLRCVSVVVTFGLINLSVPMSAVVTFGKPVHDTLDAKAKEAATKSKDLQARKLKSASHMLSAREQKSLQGSSGENPYLAGQNKWDIVYKGVNLFTGNFSTSATDMSFDGGYGIPVNITRSYSANNADEGPFGKGWNLSADVRSTAGGLLKSKSAPVRAVPVAMSEKPMAEVDANAESAIGQSLSQALPAVTATDAGGKAESVQRDVDGILTTPPWDANTNVSQYEFVTLNGQTYQVLLSNLVTTPDGTVYSYSKHGTYPNGKHAYNDSTTSDAANVLKIDSATDRQGNVTTYTYGTTRYSFTHIDGVTQEDPLVGVQMPNGHQITLNWSDVSGTSAGIWRVTSVSDNQAVRTVHYTYTTGGMLASATTPGGKTTSYGYATPYQPSGWSGSVAANILSTVTSPQGLTTTIYSTMDNLAYIGGPNNYSYVATYRVDAPNGIVTIRPTCDFSSTPELLPSNAQTRFAPSHYGGASEFADFRPDGSVLYYGCVNISDGQGQRSVYLWPWDVSKGGLTTGLQTVSRTYDYASQNLLQESQLVYVNPGQAYVLESTNSKRAFNLSNTYPTRNTTNKTYNCFGNPLSATTIEEHGIPYGSGVHPTYPWGLFTTVRTATTAYAYWGADKYYQQKAVVDPAGRVAFTDYYNSSGMITGDTTQTVYPGSKGQTYQVYDAKHGGWEVVPKLVVS